MRYPWPDGKQSAVVLSFDFDAESGFLFREPEKAKRSLADLEERRCRSPAEPCGSIWWRRSLARGAARR